VNDQAMDAAVEMLAKAQADLKAALEREQVLIVELSIAHRAASRWQNSVYAIERVMNERMDYCRAEAGADRKALAATGKEVGE